MYSVTEYYLTTNDGYILSMYQIQNNNTPIDPSKVVMMQHGLLDSSDAFMILEMSDNWTQHFLNLGYTVFVSNSRGNTYSLNHTTLHSDFEGI